MEEVSPNLVEDNKTALRKRQQDLVALIKALDVLEQSSEWQTLKALVYQPSLESIERQIRNEGLKRELDLPALYRLQGEWSWAATFTNIQTYVERLKSELQNIKRILKEN